MAWHSWYALLSPSLLSPLTVDIASPFPQIATCAVDSYFYGRLVVVPWNIIKYNVFPTSAATGPELYGTEPWYYYLLNGLLNFNIVLPLALLSLPALLAITLFERKKLAITKPGQTSAPVLLTFRLLPLYIWFAVLSVQPHKEERFMFPAFPLICFGAAFTVGMIRAAMEAIFVNVTRAPFRVSRHAPALRGARQACSGAYRIFCLCRPLGHPSTDT